MAEWLCTRLLTGTTGVRIPLGGLIEKPEAAMCSVVALHAIFDNSDRSRGTVVQWQNTALVKRIREFDSHLCLQLMARQPIVQRNHTFG